jgi:hypothetical protein
MSRLTIEWRGSEDDVGYGLGQNATDPQHHTCSELLIPNDAGDELAMTTHHGRHENRNFSVVGSSGGQKLRSRGAHGVGIGQP